MANLIDIYTANIEKFKKLKELKIVTLSPSWQYKKRIYAIQLRDIEKKNRQLANNKRPYAYIYTYNIDIAKNLGFKGAREYVKICKTYNGVNSRNIGNCYFNNIEEVNRCIEALYSISYSRKIRGG